jgi:tetratricopeptide (TPR) repeat protein
MLITAREAGFWPMIENVKRAVVRVLAEDASRHPSRKPFQLWDFYTFNSITTESVPTLDDKQTQMKWHWEASHYKLAAGNLVLDRLLGYRDPDRDVPRDFGVLLTEGNIDEELDKLLADSRLYDKQYPEYIDEIRSKVEQVLKGRPGVMCSPSYRAYQVAVAAIESGDRTGAMQQFDLALRLHDQEMAEFKRRGLPDRETGLVSVIQKLRKTGVVEHPLESWEAYQDRGNIRRASGDLAGAIDDFGEAIKRGPSNTALHFLRGTARAELLDHAGAIEDFDAGLRLDPSNITLKSLRDKSLAALAVDVR